MPRVTANEVEAILDNKSAVKNLDTFIATANLMTNKITGLAEADLKEIERYLAAHYASIANPTVQDRKRVGDSETIYARGRHGFGLDYTPYGQQAKLLDTTGTLANIEKDSGKTKVTFEALG